MSKSFTFSFICFSVTSVFAFAYTLNVLYPLLFQALYWLFYLDLKRKFEAEEDSEYEND